MKINVTKYTRGDTIKIIREWTGLSQTEFGKRIGKSRDSVKRYEMGRINYGIDVLLAIAKEFDIDIMITKDE